MPRTAPHRRRHQQGFTLLEVLVSVVILSLGLLGVAGLQAAALKYNRESQHMASAVQLAADYIEQMRIHTEMQRRAGALSKTETPVGIGLEKYLHSSEEEKKDPPPSCVNQACAPDDLSANAKYHWLTHLKRTLPNPRVQVCPDSAPFDDKGKPKKWATTCYTDSEKAKGVIAIKIGWDETVQDKDGKNFIQAAKDAKYPQLVMTYIYK